MRYELSDYEWTVIKPMLPNKPRLRNSDLLTVGLAGDVPASPSGTLERWSSR
jgi:hypothetical protein